MASFCLLLLAITASAQSTIVLSWNPIPDGSIAGYRVYQGTTSRAYNTVIAVGNTTQAALSNLTSGTTYYFAVTAYDLKGAESDFSSEVSFISRGLGLPVPWQTQVIGSQNVPDYSSATGGVFSISSSGALAGTADDFQFSYQQMAGDGEIRAQVVSVISSNAHAVAGVMIRENLSPSARYAFLGLTSRHAFRWQRRANAAGATVAAAKGGAVLPNSWVRIIRKGNRFFPLKSVDGSIWLALPSCDINMTTNVYIGLATSSGSTNSLSSAKFSNVSVAP